VIFPSGVLSSPLAKGGRKKGRGVKNNASTLFIISNGPLKGGKKRKIRRQKRMRVKNALHLPCGDVRKERG